MSDDHLSLIAGMAAATLFTRFITVAIFSRIGFPASLERWLKHVPGAVFSALIVPPLVMPQGQIQLSIDNQYLLAGIFTIWLAWKYRKFVIAVGGGTGFMLAFRWLAS